MIINCSSCGIYIDTNVSSYLCTCGVLNAIDYSNTNYFEYLGFKPSIHLDNKRLDESYEKTIQLYHPDIFINDTVDNQKEAANHSIYTNDAYKTLSNQLSRLSYYFYYVTGLEVIHKKQIHDNYLMNNLFFILYERLHNVNSKREIEELINDINNEWDKALNDFDNALKNKYYQDIKDNIYVRLSYLDKLKRRIVEKFHVSNRVG